LPAEPIEVLLEVVRLLEDLGIPYMVGGSVASSVFGIFRSTDDVDVVIDLALEKVPSLVAKLKPAFYVDESRVRDAVKQQASFNVIQMEKIQKVDVFVLPDRPYNREELRRRQLVTITEDPKRSIYMASPEDVILQKLDWYGLGGEVSDRQWCDALGVLKVQANRLDRSYLERWASDLGVSELLARALRAAGL
jgi:hypothetical protein